MQVPREAWRVIAIITCDERQDRLVVGIEIEPLLRRKEGHMWQTDSHREKERFLRKTLQALRGPARDLSLIHI